MKAKNNPPNVFLQFVALVNNKLIFLVVAVVSAKVQEDLGDFELLAGMTFRYTYQSTELTYATAEESCVNDTQGHLTSVLSQEELSFLTHAVKNLANQPATVWIGKFVNTNAHHLVASPLCRNFINIHVLYLRAH
jgi:hypothetical protein